MINIIKKSECFPAIKIGDTIKVTFKNMEVKNSKIEFIIGKVIKIHKNQNNIFITIYSSILGIFYSYSFLLEPEVINNIEIIKNQSYHKSKLYFLKKVKNQ